MSKSRMVSVLVAICGGIVSMPTFALELSLSDAVSRVVDQSHDLKKAEANVKKAEASLDAVNANRWFKLEGTASYMNMVNVENPSETQKIELPPELGGLISETLKDQAVSFTIPNNIFQAGLSLTQPIYTFGKIGNAVKSVKSAVKMADASREMTMRSVRYSAAELYWTAKMTDEIVKISESDFMR